MENNDQDKLLDHEYDGIQELDNNLPLWWLWTFFGAIIFSFIYWLHYSFSGDGPTLDQELQTAMARIEQNRQKIAQESGGSEISEEMLLANGKKVYQNFCASCHLDNGGGSVGPNLTDDYWIHGAERKDITRVIVEGVLEKGMPAWGGVIKPTDIEAVVVYVESLKGKNVSGGKGPQGEKVN
jgi:cytochrome c oxidase cbb3-type subunit III